MCALEGRALSLHDVNILVQIGDMDGFTLDSKEWSDEAVR